MAIVDEIGKSLQRVPGGGLILTSVDALVDWSRGQSLWAMPMGTACCAMELIAASFSKFDFDRLGTFPRPDPRHTDVMIVAGTICRKMAPAIKRLYEQMPDPKYVIAMGNCAVSGGIFFYDTYSVVRGVDEFLPVDVYLVGCPPRPEALQDAVLQLRELVHTRSIGEDRVYSRELKLPTGGEARAGSTDPAESAAVPKVPSPECAASEQGEPSEQVDAEAETEPEDAAEPEDVSESEPAAAAEPEDVSESEPETPRDTDAKQEAEPK